MANFLKNMDLRGRWESMTPNHKRGATVVLGACAILLIMWMAVSASNKPQRHLERDNIKKSILTDANTRELGIDALNAKVKSVSKENDQLNEKLHHLEEWRREQEKRRGTDPDAQKALLDMQKKLDRLNDKAKSLGWDVDDLKQDLMNPRDGGAAPAQPKPEEKHEQEADVDPKTGNPSARYFRGQGAQTPPVQNVQTQPDGAPVSPKNRPELKISTIVGPDKKEEASQQKDFFIPSGSLSSGVTLNGIDALTSKGAKQDPFPVVVRIQKEAILPNNVKADISECFVTMSGYGDLSSERVMLRGEKLSCETTDGNVIEVAYPSYAVGEDGKAGLRGRLVTRTGSLIAKTALAGFGSGIASAFGKTQVPVIQTGQVGADKVFQNNLSQGTLENGLSGGAGAALERLAKYYMDMADQIYPVIEVDGGRQVDIFVTTGVKLTMRDLATKKKR